MAGKHSIAREEEKDLNFNTREVRELVDSLHDKTDKDINDRTQHEKNLSKYYKRRHKLTNRNPTNPWRGSSSIVMPVIDMEIEKAKAPLANVFNAIPIVSFIPLQTRAVEGTDAAEQTMQWLLTTRMRDFKQNMEIAADQDKQNGYTIVKTIWEEETRIVTETIRKVELSQDDLNQVAEAIAAQQAGFFLDDNGEQQQFTQEDFEIVFSDITSLRFGLDVNDDIDQIAITQIMNFILDEKDEVVIKRNEVVKAAPYCYAVDPHLFIPETGTNDLEDAERITEIRFFTENDLRVRARDGFYNKKSVDNIIKNLDKPEAKERKTTTSKSTNSSSQIFSALQAAKDDREGVTFTDKEELVEIRETYTLFDIDGDGVKERVMIIWSPDTKDVLRFMEYPYEHGKWPYVQIRNEDTDSSFYSPRGIPEIIDDIDDLITQNHRDKQNHLKIVNAPVLKYRLGSNINPGNLQFIPGQMYPVMNMNDLEPLILPRSDPSFDNEENILSLWVERRLGSVELALQGSGGGEARTAQEISAVQNIGQSALTQSVVRWQRGMKKVYEQVWALWMQYGPKEFIVSQSNGGVKPLSRHEIQGKFEMQPVGTVGESNPNMLFQRAQQRLQTLIVIRQDPQLFAEISQTHEIDFAAAFQDLMNKDDFITGNRIVRKRSPEEIEQIQAQQQAAQQQQAQAQAQQQAVEANQPISLADIKGGLEQIKRESPNKGNQKVAI